MIIGIIHKGSGLGDQLFSYIATRVRAADLGVDYGFVGKEFFKGQGWMDLDWGKIATTLNYSDGIFLPIPWEYEESSGKVFVTVSHNLFELNKPYYDPEFNFIPDGSVIDGYGAQDIRYFEHRLNEAREWLKVEPLKIMNTLCVLNMRGGEYKTVPDLFLPKEYWNKGMRKILDMSYSLPIEFVIHTDDLELGKEFGFGNNRIIKDINQNWRTLRYAKNAVISNSAFAIIPRLLKHLENPEAITIAPFGWNARNANRTNWLGRPNNYYRQFTYI
jgi:hypothetical protein